MDCDPTIPTRRSITYLQLSNITLNEGALTDLLGKLPYLKHFSLLHFTLEGSGSSNEEHGGEDDKNIFCIDMPSKSLGTLKSTAEIVKIAQKVVINSPMSSFEPKMMRGYNSDKVHKMIKIDVEEYNLIGKKGKTLHIRCKSIGIIHLKCDSMSFKIDDNK